MFISLRLSLTAFFAALAWFTAACAEATLSASIWKHQTGHSAVDRASLVGALRIEHGDTRSSGGFSALWVSSDCRTLITISDYSQALPWSTDIKRSGWIQARIEYNRTGEPVGVTALGSGQVLGTNGEAIPGAIEAMAWDGRGFLISFDDRAEIYRYAGTPPAGAILSQVPEIAFQGPDIAQGNRGLESLTVLADRRIFALWEKPNGASATTAWLIDSETLHSFGYRATLKPGGATTLADGSDLVIRHSRNTPQYGVRGSGIDVYQPGQR